MRKTKLDALLRRKMGRKEFLLFAAVALLTVTGVSGALERLRELGQPAKSSGFGAGPYGR